MDLQPAQRAWHEQAVESGILERVHHGIREMPLPLAVVGVCANHGCEVLDPGEQALSGDDVYHTPPSSQRCVDHEETTRWGSPGATPPVADDVPASRQVASKIARRRLASTSRSPVRMSRHVWEEDQA